MIQRAQSLYILIALGLMIAFLFIPFGYERVTDAATNQTVLTSLKTLKFTGLIIPTAVCLLTLLISFLSFNSLSTQKMFVLFSLLISAACIGVVIYILSAGTVDSNSAVKAVTDWGGGGLIPIAAVIAEAAAYASISSDQRRLRRSNRLR